MECFITSGPNLLTGPQNQKGKMFIRKCLSVYETHAWMVKRINESLSQTGGHSAIHLPIDR